MFIKPPKAKEKTVRFSFVLSESQAELFNQYLLYVAEVAEHEVPAKEVLQLMVDAAMKADRGFQKYLKDSESATEKAESQPATLEKELEPKPAETTGYNFN